jgi:hypothetical protein
MAHDVIGRRDRENSFLFATVRDPAERAVSTIFFHVISRRGSSSSSATAATDASVIHQLRTSTDGHYGAVSDGQGGFQLRYTSPERIPAGSAWSANSPGAVLNPAAVADSVRRVVDSYDFLLLPERMDESLTAMALVMGLDVGDVLVTSSKVAGSRYHLVHRGRNRFECLPTARSFVSPGVREFLRSDEWRAMNYGDYLLHGAANRSLDRTIERLGRGRFGRALAEYRRLRDLEGRVCAPRVQFPCSDEGRPQMELAGRNCYLNFYDFGCGYPCIDSLLASVSKG